MSIGIFLVIGFLVDADLRFEGVGDDVVEFDMREILDPSIVLCIIDSGYAIACFVLNFHLNF